jgi:DNA topoisomerase-1
MWYQRLERPDGTFFYLDVDRQMEVTKKEELERIEHLRIPCAYQNVMIHKSHRAKVQAYGYDSRGRKQTIYAPWFVQTQADKKFAKVVKMDAFMPRVVERMKRDMMKTNTSQNVHAAKRKMIAVVLYLMISCGFRVGNEKYAAENQSYGLTTLEARHMRVKPREGKIYIRFVGKKGVENQGQILREDAPHVYRYLARSLAKKEGHDRVFEGLSSDDVNDYLREIHPDMTSKDIRTWNANQIFLTHIMHTSSSAPLEQPNAARVTRSINAAIDKVAHHLHHTRDVCKKNYLHPDFVELARMVVVQRDIPRSSQALA